jgi:hypothetical protein
MRQILSTSTQAPSIVLIQGAYQNFCATAGTETVYDQRPFDRLIVSPESVALAAQEAWMKFQGLVTAWRQERGAKSSITEAATCPAYQGIIGMGEMAVPFLLTTLESEGDDPDQWFWALRAITGADPVTDEDRGNYIAMSRAWLSWGLQNGYGR